MPEIALHESADEEFKAAIAFYESQQPGLGDAFLQRASESFELILAQPLAGQVLADAFRRRLIRQFPYSIVYRIENDTVFVLAVAHWSRRPDYWRIRS
jgi:plasmid stabilization system protein ParE